MKMSMRSIILALCCISLLFCLFVSSNAEDHSAGTRKAPSKLAVVSTCGDRDVAITMVYNYTYNAKIKGWWDNVEFILWGQSALKLTKDKELQDYILKMKEAGIVLTASKTCADMYGIAEKLSSLGFAVKPLGERLTDLLKDETVRVITF